MIERARTDLVASGIGYRVADLSIDVGRHTVARGDEEISLPGLSFDLLLALARDAPNMLTYDQLMERVWAPAVVNVETVNQRVKLVRNALGDDPRNPRYILSVHGRGYRMIPDSTELHCRDVTAASPGVPDALPVTRLNPPSAAIERLRLDLWIILAAVCVVAAGLAIFLWPTQQAETAPTPRSVLLEATPTIAVLPFVNLSANPDDEYFADGLSEEVLNRLALIPGLQVTARTSSFHFKGKSEDVKAIGRKLGVQHVLEGSVRREGDRIRVFVQLVSTQNGYRLWSETFERKMDSAFEIQEKIAESVAAKLALKLVAADAPPPSVNRLTDNAEALDLYLRGRHLYQSWEPERIDKAIVLFDQAIRIDADFVEAYVALAEAYFAKSLVTPNLKPNPSWEKRGQMLRRALELDPDNANALAGIGLDYMYAWNFEAAEKLLLRAESLNPNGEFVLRSLTWFYMSAGWPPQDAVKYAQRHFRLDPLNPFAALVLCQGHLAAGEYEEALAAADRSIELQPDYWPGHTFRIIALLWLGRNAEALEEAQRSLKSVRDPSHSGLNLSVIEAYVRMGKLEEAAKVFAVTEQQRPGKMWPSPDRAYALTLLGRTDDALTALESAFNEHLDVLPETLTFPVFIPLYDEPRFRKIVAALKFERRIEFTRRIAEARRKAAAEG